MASSGWPQFEMHRHIKHTQRVLAIKGTAQMTLPIVEQQTVSASFICSHFLFFFFFWLCLSGFGFWHTASIKAFKMQSNADSETERAMRAVSQSFTCAVSQAVSLSVCHSCSQLFSGSCRHWPKSKMCALHAQKQNYIPLKNNAAAHKSTSTQ